MLCGIYIMTNIITIMHLYNILPYIEDYIYIYTYMLLYIIIMINLSVCPNADIEGIQGRCMSSMMHYALSVLRVRDLKEGLVPKG